MIKNLSKGLLTIALALTIAIPISSYAEALSAAEVITILHQVGANDALIASVSIALGVTPERIPPSPSSNVLGATTVACPSLTRTLSLRTTHPEVLALQKFFVSYYNLSGPDGDILTGYFGLKTLALVKRFQTEQGIIPVSGIVGPLTRAAIKAECDGTSPGSLTPASIPAGALFIGNSNNIPAQNIVVNVPNQPLGGFTTYVTNEGEEGIRISGMTFLVTGTASSNLLTNVTVVDQGGSVVAGPANAYMSNGTQLVTFTDPVTFPFSGSVAFPVGARTFTIRGKVPATVPNNTTIALVANPAGTWLNPTGVVTGFRFSLSTVAPFTMNSMTVRKGAMTIGRSSSPASRSIAAGGVGELFVNFQFDASQSGEDVRFTSVPVKLTYTGGAVTNLTSCRLFDGATALNTGLNVWNPSGSSPVSSVVALDNPVAVAKGTVRTLGMKCNVSASTPTGSTYEFDLQNASAFPFMGASSGSTITGTDAADNPVIVTIGGASLSLNVSTDASTPSYQLVAAGSPGVTLGVYRLYATQEPVNITKLNTFLSSGSPLNIQRLQVYAGASLIGTGYFAGLGQNSTITFSSPLQVPKNVDMRITIKGDLSNIGTESPGVSGDLIQLQLASAEGIGASSGTVIGGNNEEGPKSSPSPIAGVRIFKSYPTVSLDTLPSTGVEDGRLMRFRVTADSHGPVGLGKFVFTWSSNNTSPPNALDLYAYTDSNYSSPVGTGPHVGGTSQVTGTLVIGPTYPIEVPTGTTYYFELRGNVSALSTGATFTTTLLGDANFASPQSGIVLREKSTNFVWSPNSTTTAVFSDNDWTSGYGVPGLPPNGLSQTRTGGSSNTPAPTCVLSFSPPTTLPYPQGTATFIWSSTNATAGSINWPGSAGPMSVGANGSLNSTFLPQKTTTYTGTFTGPGGTATCSATLNVTNVAPSVPVVTVPTKAYPNTVYTISFNSTDPNGDQVRYGIDDGIGTVHWWSPSPGYTPSGTAFAANGWIWPSVGSRTYKILAEDANGARSAWGSFTVNVTALPTGGGGGGGIQP